MKYQGIQAGIILSVCIFLSACASVQTSRNVEEERWTRVTESEAGGVGIFVDDRGMQRISDTIVRLQVRYRYSSPKPFDSGYINELVAYNEYDCGNKETYKILWTEAHYVDGGIRRDESERQGYILSGDAVFRYVCK